MAGPDEPAEWRVNTDGSIDAGLPQYIYRQGEVILTGNPTAPFDSERRAVQVQTTPTLSAAGTVAGVSAFGEGEGRLIDRINATASPPSYQWTFDGQPNVQVPGAVVGPGIWPAMSVQDPGIGNEWDAGGTNPLLDLARKVGGQRSLADRTVNAQSVDADAALYIDAGDTVHVQDLATYWLSGKGDPISYAGESAYTIPMRVHLMDWTASDNYSIWLYSLDTGNALDLSDYVVYPAPTMFLQLGEGAGPASTVLFTTPDRFRNYVEGITPGTLYDTGLVPSTGEGTGPNNPPSGPGGISGPARPGAGGAQRL